VAQLDLLKNRGVAVVTAYADPPEFMTAKCDTDTPCGYQFMRDVDVGDFVTVFAREGFCVTEEKARITRVQLNQKDADGNVGLDMELVPALEVGASQVVE
jgi:hypothetical protein